MGFEKARKLLIRRLKSRNFDYHEERNKIWIKNKLYTKEVSVDFVLNKIIKCTKENYDCQEFLEADDNKFHIFEIDYWYFKYFLKKGIVTIVSVHKDEYHV